MRLVANTSFLLLALSLMLDTRASESVAPLRPAIATSNAQATDAGMEVLAAGGNAFDAAIAISATLGLVEPESSGIGGGGFFLLHLASENRTVFVDARERAPLAATADMFLDAERNPVPNASIDGALAAAIPGLPAGLVHVSRKYGRLPLSQSLAPAIRLAREGWVFNRKNAEMMGWRVQALSNDPGSAALFLPGGQPPKPGQKIRNPDYARTLELLAEHGEKGFYAGRYASQLVAGVRAGGGIWSETDLANYKVVEREPLRIRHRGFEIVTAPPPSSGGIAIAEVLNILDGYRYSELPSTQRLHLTLEAMRRAYRDRAIYLGDPDFVEVPSEMLMSDDYAAGLRAAIHPVRATPSELLPGVGETVERDDTTHFSLLDTDGNLVAVTQTVNLPYGNAFVVPGTGFLLNNEMDDFSIKTGVPNAFGLVGQDANAIAPGKRPLSSMSPSFVINDERIGILGTPGGSRIISMVLLGILHLMDGGGAQATADLPRIHHQYLPDVVSIEEGALSAEAQADLVARGYQLETGRDTWGNMQVVIWNRLTGEVEAGADGRWKDVGKGSTGEERGDGKIFR